MTQVSLELEKTSDDTITELLSECGLKPSHCWKVYQINAHPGTDFISRFFLVTRLFLVYSSLFVYILGSFSQLITECCADTEFPDTSFCD